MVDKNDSQSNSSPMIQKILALLSELKQSGQGVVFYSHIKQSLEHWESTHQQTNAIYAEMVDRLLDAFIEQLPKDSMLRTQLKLVRTCLKPPLSQAELGMLQDYIDHAASLIKQSGQKLAADSLAESEQTEQVAVSSALQEEDELGKQDTKSEAPEYIPPPPESVQAAKIDTLGDELDQSPDLIEPGFENEPTDQMPHAGWFKESQQLDDEYSQFPQPTSKETKKGIEAPVESYGQEYFALHEALTNKQSYFDMEEDVSDEEAAAIAAGKADKHTPAKDAAGTSGLDNVAINQSGHKNPVTLREKLAERKLIEITQGAADEEDTNESQLHKVSRLQLEALNKAGAVYEKEKNRRIIEKSPDTGDMVNQAEENQREKSQQQLSSQESGQKGRQHDYLEYGKGQFVKEGAGVADDKFDMPDNIEFAGMDEEEGGSDKIRFLEKSDEEKDELLATERYRRELDEQRQEMERLQRDFVQQMRTIVSESAEFGVHLGLEIDALEDAEKIHNVEDRRRSILKSLKNLNQSHTELARKFDTAQTYLSIIESDNQKLSDELDRVRMLSLTDELTSLPNRRAFLRRLEDEVSRVKRYGFPLSLVIIDIDHFKQVNDKHGHPAGDTVLRVYAEKILSIFRHHDMVARYGGEEFAVLLPNTDLEGVVGALDKVQSMVPTVEIKINGIAIPAPTFSAGVTEYRTPETTTQFIERADSALYRAKRLGRNRIEVEAREAAHDIADTTTN